MKKDKILFLIGLLIVIVAFMPVAVHGIFNVGVWGLALFGAVVAVLPYLHKKMADKPKIRKAVFAVINTVMALGLAVVIVVLILLQTYPTAPMPEDATVVVLGCQVKDYGPSLMLTGRLKTAEK